MEGEAAKTGRRMGIKLGAGVKAGLVGARKAVAGMFGSIKGHVKTAATLGGAFALGKLVKDAAAMSSEFRNIAHQVNKVSGNAETWQSIQSRIEPIAMKTGQNTAAMAEAFRTVFGATGDLEFTTQMLESMGTIATASGKDIGLLANVAEKVNRKFGLTGKNAADAIALIASRTDVGGPSLDAFGRAFDIMATEAENAGLAGEKGLKQLLGIMNELDAKIGVEAPDSLKELFKAFDRTSPQMRQLAKIKVGFKVDESADFAERLRSTMRDPKLFASLEQTITGPAKRAFQGMTEPYRKALREAEARGETPKAATEAAIAAYDKFIAKLDKSGKTVEDYTKDAQDRLKDDPSVQIRLALNKVAQAFTKPEMIAAIERLAKVAPKLADALVTMLDFITKHPYLSAGMAVGGKAAMGFGQGYLSSPGGQAAAKAAGSVASKAFLSKVGAGGAWAKAGQVLGVAAAAYVGWKVGEAIADHAIESKEKVEKTAFAARMGTQAAVRSGDVKRQEEQLAKIHAAMRQTTAERTSFAGRTRDVLGFAASVVTGGEVKMEGERYQDEMARLRAEESKLRESLNKLYATTDKGKGSTDRAARATQTFADNVEKAGKALGKLVPPGQPPGGGPGKGPPGSLPNQPGHG
jgi:hypothetical protein